MSEEEMMMEWNAANSRLQARLTDDPACQGFGVELEPTIRLIVVLEPGRSLTAASVAEVAIADRIRPVAVVQGVTPKRRLERARQAVEDAARRVQAHPETKGVMIGTDWIRGRVLIRGDARHGQAIADEAAIDPDLVIVEEGPGMRRL